MGAYVSARMTVFEGLCAQMLLYVHQRFLGDELQLVYVHKLSDRTIPVRKRRKGSTRQTSYAFSVVLYVRPQGRFKKNCTICITCWAFRLVERF